MAHCTSKVQTQAQYAADALVQHDRAVARRSAGTGSVAGRRGSPTGRRTGGPAADQLLAGQSRHRRVAAHRGDFGPDVVGVEPADDAGREPANGRRAERGHR